MLKRRNTAQLLAQIAAQEPLPIVFCTGPGGALSHYEAVRGFSTQVLQTELRNRFKQDAQLAGSRFELRDGLRASEVTLLRRALGFYVSAYTTMRREAKLQHEKDEHQQYITAALGLDDKLLRDLAMIKPKEQQ